MITKAGRGSQLPVLVCTGACFLSIGLLIPVLPRYVTGPLGHGALMVGVTIAIPSVTGIVARPFVGRFTDHCGRRWSAVIGAGLLGLTALAMLGATCLPLLLTVRALAGVGEAFVFVGLAAAASDLAPSSGAAAVLNRFSISVYIGLLAGPPLGELVRAEAGFDAVWLLSAGVAALTAVGCLSLPGGVTPGNRGRGGLVHRPALIPGIAYGASIWGYTAFGTFIPLYVSAIGGTDARMHYLVYGFVLLAVRLLGHRVFVRVAPRTTAMVSLGLTAVGLAMLAAWPTLLGAACATAVLGAGQALGFPAFTAMAVDGVPAERRGSALATVTAFFDVGFLTSALGLGAVTQSLGLTAGFVVAGGIAAGALFLFTPRRSP